jgi:hypothetical protein
MYELLEILLKYDPELLAKILAHIQEQRDDD